MYCGKITLNDSLHSTFLLLKPFYCNISYSDYRPHQIVIKLGFCSVLIFNTSKIRFMGKATFESVQSTLDFITSILDSHVVVPLCKVTETVVFKLNKSNINLYKLVFNAQPCVLELELFPALSLNLWKPLHVNVFSTGKVVLLGKNALDKKDEIEKWLIERI